MSLEFSMYLSMKFSSYMHVVLPSMSRDRIADGRQDVHRVFLRSFRDCPMASHVYLFKYIFFYTAGFSMEFADPKN